MIDWSCWDGSHFGDPFEPRALQKRRAYKKWAEMLLQPEVSEPDGKPRFTGAKLYLDKLQIMYGYDVIDAWFWQPSSKGKRKRRNKSRK